MNRSTWFTKGALITLGIILAPGGLLLATYVMARLIIRLLLDRHEKDDHTGSDDP